MALLGFSNRSPSAFHLRTPSKIKRPMCEKKLCKLRPMCECPFVEREKPERQNLRKTKIMKIEKGTKTKEIKNKSLVAGNGHGGRKLYKVPGEFNDVLLICQKGEVIETVEDLAKQDQRILQGW